MTGRICTAYGCRLYICTGCEPRARGAVMTCRFREGNMMWKELRKSHWNCNTLHRHAFGQYGYTWWWPRNVIIIGTSYRTEGCHPRGAWGMACRFREIRLSDDRQELGWGGVSQIHTHDLHFRNVISVPRSKYNIVATWLDRLVELFDDLMLLSSLIIPLTDWSILRASHVVHIAYSSAATYVCRLWSSLWHRPIVWTKYVKTYGNLYIILFYFILFGHFIVVKKWFQVHTFQFNSLTN